MFPKLFLLSTIVLPVVIAFCPSEKAVGPNQADCWTCPKKANGDWELQGDPKNAVDSWTDFYCEYVASLLSVNIVITLGS